MPRILICCYLLILLLPAHAQDQNRLNEQARQRYVKVEAEMNRVYKEIESRLKSPALERFRKSQQAWLTYRDAEAYAAVAGHEGGLRAIEIDYTVQTEVTQRRLVILRHWMERFSF